MLKASSPTMMEGTNNKRHLLTLENLEKLEVMARNIEAKTESPKVLLMYGKSAKKLSNEVKNALNIVLYEHDTALEQQKREMLNQLEHRLQEFSRTVEHCERLVDVLHGRNIFMAGLMRVWDLRRIKELQAEAKTRGADLERGFTRLKRGRLEDDGQSTRIVYDILEDQQKQQPSSRTQHAPSTSDAPKPSHTDIASVMNPTTILANANATIAGGRFNAVGNSMYPNTVYVCNSQNTNIHNHFHN